MPQHSIDIAPEGVPEIEEILEVVLLQALDIARETLDSQDELVPFTALAVGETLFTETHPTENPEDCFKMARHTVQNARGALAYAFCYDGYVDTDQGQLDVIIAEGGVPGGETGHAVGLLYTVEGEGESLKYLIEEQALYIGQSPNFMEFTLIVPEDEGIDEDTDDDDESASKDMRDDRDDDRDEDRDDDCGDGHDSDDRDDDRDSDRDSDDD